MTPDPKAHESRMAALLARLNGPHLVRCSECGAHPAQFQYEPQTNDRNGRCKLCKGGPVTEYVRWPDAERAIAETRAYADSLAAQLEAERSVNAFALLAACDRAAELERFLEEHGEAVGEALQVFGYGDAIEAFRALRGMR